MKNIKFIRFFFFLSCFFFTLHSYGIETSNNKIIKYFDDFESFSANFIQVNESTIVEGKFFFNNKRIRVDYLNPSKIILIIDKKKAMYLNIDLEEIQYFNPQESTAEIFYNIFFSKNITNNATIQENSNSIKLIKEIIKKNQKITLKLTFEKKPINLRKIQILTDDEEINFGIFSYNFNPNFDIKFFSMANPLIR